MRLVCADALSMKLTRSMRRWMSALLVVLLSGIAAAVPQPAAGAAGSSYSLSYQSGSGAVLRWNPCQRAITYRVNLRYAGSSATARSSALADVKGAITKLSAATGIRFAYLGGTTRIPSGSTWWQHTGDAELIVAWVNQNRSSSRSSLLLHAGSSYTAATGGWWSWQWGSVGTSAALVRGYVVVNARDNSKLRAGFGSGTTRGGLLMHELGHVVGLNHARESSQLMYPVLLARSKAAYATGDLAGLSRVGRRAGCISIPANVGAPKDL
ncbi:MAG: hypothetical protein RL745_319 [Actinomycetota bacterium]